MADFKPKTVTVQATQVHTAFGHAYKVGDVYEMDEAFVDSVVQQGKVVRVPSKDSTVKPKASQPVEPMSTDNSGLAPKK